MEEKCISFMLVMSSTNVFEGNDIFWVLATHYFFFTPNLGEMIQFDSYFSDGLVQPPTSLDLDVWKHQKQTFSDSGRFDLRENQLGLGACVEMKNLEKPRIKRATGRETKTKSLEDGSLQDRCKWDFIKK